MCGIRHGIWPCTGRSLTGPRTHAVTRFSYTKIKAWLVDITGCRSGPKRRIGNSFKLGSHTMGSCGRLVLICLWSHGWAGACVHTGCWCCLWIGGSAFTPCWPSSGGWMDTWIDAVLWFVTDDALFTGMWPGRPLFDSTDLSASLRFDSASSL